jgi:hypothetical protein
VLKVSGTVTRNGDDRDVDRTTTVEIKDVGTTKITVPDEAKSKDELNERNQYEISSRLLGTHAPGRPLSLMAADKDDVKSAAQKLGGSDNYSWTTTMESAAIQSRPQPRQNTKGRPRLARYDDAGQHHRSLRQGRQRRSQNRRRLAVVGPDAAKEDGGGGFNPSRFMVMRLRNFKAPAVQAEEIAGNTKDLTKTGDVYAGDLTEEGAKNLIDLWPSRRPGTAPAISNAKGSVKFWIKDGVITKYQTQGFRHDEEPATATTWTLTAQPPWKSKTSARPKSRCRTKPKKKMI